MGNSEDSFYTFYFTFIKNLELSFLFLESKFCIIPQIDLRKVIKNFISFRVFLKYRKFLSVLSNVLNFTENQKNSQNNWFFHLIKLFKKKIELFYFLFYKSFSTSPFSMINFNEKGVLFDKILCCSIHKFLEFYQNNHFTAWKTIIFSFECSVCQKTIFNVRSAEIFNLTNFFHINIFFFKFLTRFSSSKKIKGVCCNNTTRIFKKVLWNSDTIFLLENFIFFDKEPKKIYLCYIHDEFLIEEFCIKFKKVVLRKMAFLPKFLIKKNEFILGNYQDYFFLKYPESFKENIKKETCNKNKLIYTGETNFRYRIEKLKQIEQTYLETQKEKINKIIKF